MSDTQDMRARGFTIRLECKHGIEFWASDEADKITWQEAAQMLGCECSKALEAK